MAEAPINLLLVIIAILLVIGVVIALYLFVLPKLSQAGSIPTGIGDIIGWI